MIGIKGLKMPESCYSCTEEKSAMPGVVFYCRFNRTKYFSTEEAKEGRRPWCPLVRIEGVPVTEDGHADFDEIYRGIDDDSNQESDNA